jgi:hypothetical protein
VSGDGGVGDLPGFALSSSLITLVYVRDSHWTVCWQSWGWLAIEQVTQMCPVPFGCGWCRWGCVIEGGGGWMRRGYGFTIPVHTPKPMLNLWVYPHPCRTLVHAL